MTTRPTQHYYLAFNQINGIGATTLNKLITQFGSVEQIFQASPSALQTTNLKPNQIDAIKQFNWKLIEPSLRWLELDHHHILTWEDDHYPTRLKTITQPPPILFVVGDVTQLSQPQLAIVGSRQPTLIGRENSENFARHLCRSGLTITSGLAVGIDSAAHRGALSEEGYTIAVLGSGIDRIYPKQHQQLAKEIIAHGAIVSEFALGSAPLAKNFPQRNRIISGLSLGTLVIEAALKSGSLLSARYALEQGREIFALPGSIHNPLAKGCHHLIQQGAKLVQTVNDIIEEFPQQSLLPPCPTSPAVNTTLTTEEQALLCAIGESPTPFNTIMARANFTFTQTTSLLLELQLRGLIARVTGGYCQTGKNSEEKPYEK